MSLSLIQCLQRVQPASKLADVVKSTYFGLAKTPGVAVKADALLEIHDVLQAILMSRRKLNQVPLRAAVHLVCLQNGFVDVCSEAVAVTIRVAVAHLRRIAINEVKYTQATRLLSLADAERIHQLCVIINNVMRGDPPPQQTLSEIWASPATETAESTEQLSVPVIESAGVFDLTWDPEAFARAASKNQRQLATPQRQPAVEPQSAEKMVGAKDRGQGEGVAITKTTGDGNLEVKGTDSKDEKSTGEGQLKGKGTDSKDTTPDTKSTGVGNLKGKGKDSKEKKSCSKSKCEGNLKGKYYAPAIGRLTLSLGATKSEICYTSEGEKTRKHLTTIEVSATTEHRSLAVALIRLACSTKSCTVADLRAVKAAKVAELKKKRAY
jgi:hypothetical protein